MARRSPWPTVLGTAALVALPVLAAAQSGQASTTGSQASQPKAQSDTRYPVGSGAATHHLTEAKQVLDGIPRNAVTGSNASKLNEIRREFAALQRAYAANPSTAASPKSSSDAKADWNTKLMALDRDLSALLGASSEGTSASSGTTGTTGSTETETAGTSGSSASRPSSGNMSSESSSLDPNVRSQLQEFRKHITEFAEAASGTQPGGEMSSSSASSTTGATSSMGTTGSTGTAGTTGSSTSASTPAEPTTQSSTSSSQTTPPTSSSSQTSSATGEATQSQSGQTATTGTSNAQVDAAAARQHLTEARQSLADLTALPQAQQLQGDARNQVSQLISQFNQLITTQDDWRSAYDQVNGTLTTLLSNSSASSSSTSSESAVGTSGSASASGNTSVDPAIRAKLEEFRTHLQAFFSAAGGDAAESSSSAGSSPMGSGTSSSTGDTGSAAGASSSEAESHIDAIERILDQAGGSASATGTSGTTGSTSSTTGSSTAGSSTAGSTTGAAPGTPSTSSASGVTLTQQQIDQIRMHLQQLRTTIKK